MACQIRIQSEYHDSLEASSVAIQLVLPLLIPIVGLIRRRRRYFRVIFQLAFHSLAILLRSIPQMPRLGSLSPTVLLLSLQILTRLFTFVLNQVLIRLSDPSQYGAAHIHLELLLGLVLFLSREGIRGASLREHSSMGDEKKGRVEEQERVRKAKNLALVPIPLGLAFAGIALPLFLRTSQTGLTTQPYYATVIYLYLVSALLELLAEPLYVHALSSRGERNLALRVRAEGTAAIVKGVVTLAAVVLLGQNRGLLAFGLGQLAYGGAVLFTFLLSYFTRLGTSQTLALYHPELRQPSASKRIMTTADPLNGLALSLFFQSILKHLLTEADKLAVSRLTSLEDQGGYALGTNYASLPLRLLFQPLEESSRFQFSQSLGSVQLLEDHDKNQVEQTKANRSSEKPKASPASHDAAAIQQSLALLSSLLRLHFYLALFLLAFLPPLARPFIEFLSGPQWSLTSAPRTLAAFAYFLPIAGISGILEGFVQTTASQKELKKYNRVILGGSIVFVAMVWILIRLTTVEEALVYASTCSMMVRAIYGWVYARTFFAKTPSDSQHSSFGHGLLPSSHVIGHLMGAAISLRWVSANLVKRYPWKTGLYSLMLTWAPVLMTALTCGLGALYTV